VAVVAETAVVASAVFAVGRAVMAAECNCHSVVVVVVVDGQLAV
jgi:hypothetical protein